MPKPANLTGRASLMSELVRINGLRLQLRIVRDVTAKIEESGAPYLCQQVEAAAGGNNRFTLAR